MPTTPDRPVDAHTLLQHVRSGHGIAKESKHIRKPLIHPVVVADKTRPFQVKRTV